MLRHLQNNKNRIVTMLVALSGLSITVRFMDAHQSTGNQQAAVLPNAGARRERPHLNVRKGESSFKTASPSLSDVHLEPVVTYSSAGFSAGSIAVADLNGDGKPDLAVSNDLDLAKGQGSVGVLLGNGDGSFLPAQAYDSGGYGASSVAIADVNGDGKPDLLVANSCAIPFVAGNCFGDGSVGVLLGNGDGTFKLATTIDTGRAFTNSVIVTDVNLDGKADLVVANYNDSIAVLIGNGDGTFKLGAMYSSLGIVSVATGDLNGDGKPDLLTANLYDNVSVLLGNGDGTFQPAVVYSPGGFYATSVIAQDVNGDGIPDLLVSNQFVNNKNLQADGVIGVLLGNGDGSFRTAVTFDSGGAATESIAVGDVNGDGHVDVVAINFAPGSDNGIVGVLLGNGDGTFQHPVTFSSGGTIGISVTVADVNGDGKPDVLVANACGSQCTTTTGVAGVLLNAATTSSALTSNLNPSTYGQSVTWTANVTTSGKITPTGLVTFAWSGHTIGSVTLNGSGVATLTKSNLNADSYPLTAIYEGDADNLGSTSAVLNQVVLQATSSAALTSSPNPSTQGQAVTFTAKISSPTVTPKGPVTFTAGKTVLGTAQLSGGKATLIVSSLAVGSTKVTATYNGDSNITKSSASVAQVVQ